MPQEVSNLKKALESAENLGAEDFEIEASPTSKFLLDAKFNGKEVSILKKTQELRIVNLEPLATFEDQQSQGEKRIASLFFQWNIKEADGRFQEIGGSLKKNLLQRGKKENAQSA